jgi:hypothetical protein
MVLFGIANLKLFPLGLKPPTLFYCSLPNNRKWQEMLSFLRVFTNDDIVQNVCCPFSGRTYHPAWLTLA